MPVDADWLSMGMWTMCASSRALGYLSFRGLVQSEVLDSFPAADIPAAYVVDILRAVHNACGMDKRTLPLCPDQSRLPRRQTLTVNLCSHYHCHANSSSNNNTLTPSVFRVLLVIHLIFYYPVYFAVTRHSLAKVLSSSVQCYLVHGITLGITLAMH